MFKYGSYIFLYINFCRKGVFDMNRESYEINSSTLVLIPLSVKETKVIEVDDEFTVNDKCVKLVDRSCRFFGSSLIGRQEGSKSLLNVSIKVPIIVEESRNILFFPTNSPREESCMWVSYNNLLKYIKIDKRKTRLYFVNGKTIVVDISYNIIDNQVTRCIKLEKILFDRKNVTS